jgi:CSLREA domain-containing protein
MTCESVMPYSAMKEETMSNKPSIPYRTGGLTAFWIKVTMLWKHIPRRIVAALAAAALFTLVTGCNLPSGHTFIVTYGEDDPDTNPGDGKCEIASGLGCTLRAAIEEANAISGADKIHFNFPFVTDIHAWDGYPLITENLTIDGRTQPGYVDHPIQHLSFIGSSSQPSYLFRMSSGVSVSVFGLVITSAPTYAFWNQGNLQLEKMEIYSGSILSVSLGDPANLTVVSSRLSGFCRKPILEAVHSTVSITSSTISNNSIQDPSFDAGGVVIRDGTATIVESEIKNNSGWKSGGLYIEDAEVHLSQTSVTENTGWDAGGIYVESDSELWVEHSWIGGATGGNTAAIISGIYSEGIVHISDSIVEGNSGAGIHSRGVGGNAILDVANSDISRNSLAGIHATQSDVNITESQIRINDNGGIFLAQGSLTVTDSSVSSNQNNGGIHVEAASVLINKSTISGNSASDKGGGVSLYATLGTVEIVNSTISGNQASNSGGGIAEVGGIVELKNVTVAQNSAGRGSGLFNGIGTFRVTNTIVADNSGGNCEGTITSGGHNLDTRDTCGFSGPGDISNMNAGLGPLQDNGGSTKTHALPNDSPALEAGDDAACEATDQRGISRPQGLHCDMGAFEAENPVTATPPSVTNTPRRSQTPTNTPTRTAIGFLFDPIEFSPEILSRHPDCGPTQVTVRVRISPAELAGSVGLFFRLEEKNGSRVTPWNSVAMKPMGDGWYQVTINTGSLPDTPEWAQDALLAVQFTANGDALGNEILARSPVFRQVTVLQCQAPGKTATPTRRPVG